MSQDSIAAQVAARLANDPHFISRVAVHAPASGDGVPPIVIAFSALTIVTALVGVVIQTKATHFADLGEIPDVQGAFIGGTSGGPFEVGKAWHRDLRKHYRQSATSLGRVANFILLSSVISAVLAGLSESAPLAVACGILWFMIVFVSLTDKKKRSDIIDAQETALEKRRIAYNEKFGTGLSELIESL